MDELSSGMTKFEGEARDTLVSLTFLSIPNRLLLCCDQSGVIWFGGGGGGGICPPVPALWRRLPSRSWELKTSADFLSKRSELSTVCWTWRGGLFLSAFGTWLSSADPSSCLTLQRSLVSSVTLCLLTWLMSLLFNVVVVVWKVQEV